MCSYLVDPKIKVSVKSIRPDLKDKLQLNFSKV